MSDTFFGELYSQDAPGQDYFGTPNLLQKHDLPANIATDIVAVGFPDLKTDEYTNRPVGSEPVIYTGAIATPIDRSYPLQSGVNIPGFLVNLPTTPGASGSPVLLRPGMPWRTTDGKTHLGVTTPALLLGVLAETRFAPVKLSKFSGHGFSGAGLAFAASTVVETVHLFTK
ncbi:MAG: hypothetical protein KF753_16905 [Caldilineaceae bacterium]|nr:hypothetical protein [Caldilineaceae bacterium]